MGSTSTRSICESGLTRSRPIQLTGSVIVLIATVRIALRIVSRKSKRGSLSRPPTGKDTRMSPRESRISATARLSGRPALARAVPSLGAARTTWSRLSWTSARAVEGVVPNAPLDADRHQPLGGLPREGAHQVRVRARRVQPAELAAQIEHERSPDGPDGPAQRENRSRPACPVRSI